MKKKTPQSKINNNKKWAKNNLLKVRSYKNKYKTKTKELTRQYVSKIKQESGCKFCGNTNTFCLDFHHKDNSIKRDTVCNLVRHGYSLQIIKDEIIKCDIICSNCHRTTHYSGKYMRNKKAQQVYNIKQNSQCLHCGYSKIECLDFHHPNDNKKDGIGSMIRDKKVSLIQLEKEIAKCIILCSNCHRILHSSERGKEH